MSDQPMPAAEYVRMSTEDQKYSILNQQNAISQYAQANGYRVVQTFSDAGISGLNLKHRPGLKALLNAVVSGGVAFQTVLVLDVSRWGRFQDIDEAAYYEFLCRQSGVRIQYCAEAFENDNTAYSNLVKSIKRTMAAEFSRELGTKVFRGQARLAALGYKQGGTPQLGLRRMLLDLQGNPVKILKKGERKHLITERVVLVLGPAGERRCVRRIFESFLEGTPTRLLARELRRNHRYGRNWTTSSVLNLLRNPQYIGDYVYNRTSTRLKTCRIVNPREQLVIKAGALQPIIPIDLFNRVQAKLDDFAVNLSNEELLRRLKLLWDEKGYLTARFINESADVPSASMYRRRFHTLAEALRLIGFPLTGGEGISKRKVLATVRRKAWRALKESLRENGMHLRETSKETYYIEANGLPVFHFLLALPFQVCSENENRPIWHVRMPRRMPIGRCVVGMLSSEQPEILEFIVAPALRKSPVFSFTLNLPLTARISLARFKSPSEFWGTLKLCGFVR